jgi:hypothetical protein
MHLPRRCEGRVQVRARVRLPAVVRVRRLRLLQSNQVNGDRLALLHEERLADKDEAGAESKFHNGCRARAEGPRLVHKGTQAEPE